MTVPWPETLLGGLHDSARRFSINGHPIFNGLRVRMAAHIGQFGCESVNEVQHSQLMKDTQLISQVSQGGQILVSHDLFVALQRDDQLDDMDSAPVGCIARPKVLCPVPADSPSSRVGVGGFGSGSKAERPGG